MDKINKRMITSHEAKKLNRLEDVNYLILLIERKIIEVAKNKNFALFRNEPFAHYALDEFSNENAKKMKSILEDHGYKVSLYYKQDQIIDYGMLVEW
jgi:hypothetical protein